jgi:hypothetical protein
MSLSMLGMMTLTVALNTSPSGSLPRYQEPTSDAIATVGMTWEDIWHRVSEVDAKSYTAIWDEGVVAIESGTLVRIDEHADQLSDDGMVLVEGNTYWNPTEFDVVIVTKRAECPEQREVVPGRSVIYVGRPTNDTSAVQPGGTPCTRSRSVSCGPGTYACCYMEGTARRARCIANGDNPPTTCEAGGAGATSCTISEPNP